MALQLDTLELLNELLLGSQIHVGGENFEENAPKIARAKKELRREIQLRQKVAPKKPKASATKKRPKRKR
jgi:hypothetical protein